MSHPKAGRSREELARVPRNWPELRRAVVEENYLSTTELEQRRRRAAQMKYGIWILPVAMSLVVVVLVTGEAPLASLAAAGLLSVAAVVSYRTGTVWEQRWATLRDARQREQIATAQKRGR